VALTPFVEITQSWPWMPWTWILLQVMLSVGVAAISFYGLEQHFLRLKGKVGQRRQAPAKQQTPQAEPDLRMAA
jgi:peptidoglycan/LPS O-acetylase OafA/YrhL